MQGPASRLPVVVTCEKCYTRHHLARQDRDAGVFHIMCHKCEVPLRVELPVDVAYEEKNPRQRAPRVCWSSLIKGL